MKNLLSLSLVSAAAIILTVAAVSAATPSPSVARAVPVTAQDLPESHEYGQFPGATTYAGTVDRQTAQNVATWHKRAKRDSVCWSQPLAQGGAPGHYYVRVCQF